MCWAAELSWIMPVFQGESAWLFPEHNRRARFGLVAKLFPTFPAFLSLFSFGCDPFSQINYSSGPTLDAIYLLAEAADIGFCG